MYCMKKKGFTLIELIAVMAIMSILTLFIGRIYVSYTKRSEEVKIKTDIENSYRNTYDILKNSIEKGDKVSILNKSFTINKNNISNNLVEDKVWLFIKNNNSNNNILIATFKNIITNEKSLYAINVNEDYENNSESQIKINNTLSLNEISKNIEEFSLGEFNNSFYFKIVYLKDKISMPYEFSINKVKDRIINVTDKNAENNGHTDNQVSSLKSFYESLSTLTVLNNSKIRVRGSLFLSNSSYFLNGVESSDTISDARQLYNVIRNNEEFWGTVSINNVENKNDGKLNPQILDLIFNRESNENYKLNRGLEDEIKDLSLKESGSYKLLKDNKYPIGVVIKTGDNKYVVLINGSLTIEDELDNYNSLLIYASDNLKLEGNGKILNNSSLVAGNNLYIQTSIMMNGEFTADDKTKEYISAFLRK